MEIQPLRSNMATPVYIVGHKNPDNDSIAAAVGYAYLKNELMKRTLQENPEAEEFSYVPVRLGPLPQESEAVLNEYSIEAPQLINHVHACIKDVMTSDVISLPNTSTLLDAGRLLRKHNKRAVVVTNEENKYAGLISLRSIANHYLCAMDNIEGNTINPSQVAESLVASLSQPVTNVLEEDVLFLNEEDLLGDVAPAVLSSELRDGIVLDEEGHCTGIVTRTDVAKRPKQKIILVDHNERSQAVNGIDDAEVVEIVDHHRIGDVSTANPIRFNNLPVGSSATIVAMQFAENNVEIPLGIAAVLLSAIMTDTVILKSPTATAIDAEISEKLAAIVGMPVKDFGLKVLSYRGGDADLPIEKLVTADSKEFVIGSDTVLIAQHETVTLDIAMKREPEIRQFLSKLREDNDYAYVLLLVTDIIEEGSMFIVEGLHGQVDRVFGIDSSKSVWMPGVLSRKKQVAAPLLEA
jgi:manganese-dependent inorganic pyrophosphatase